MNATNEMRAFIDAAERLGHIPDSDAHVQISMGDSSHKTVFLSVRSEVAAFLAIRDFNEGKLFLVCDETRDPGAKAITFSHSFGPSPCNVLLLA
jgi:hypothetical protein